MSRREPSRVYFEWMVLSLGVTAVSGIIVLANGERVAGALLLGAAAAVGMAVEIYRRRRRNRS
jgi:hypothetical protein